MNKTVHSLVSVIGGTKQALEDRLNWITKTLGGTDIALERLYAVLWHFAFLIGAMIICAFLNANSSIRILVFVILPANLALQLNYNEHSFSPIGLLVLISLFVLCKYLIPFFDALA